MRYWEGWDDVSTGYRTGDQKAKWQEELSGLGVQGMGNGVFYKMNYWKGNIYIREYQKRDKEG